MSAENNKAAGTDNLKPAFLKQDDCIQFLHQRFQFCFKNSITPTPWSKGIIIQPIPKGSTGSQNPRGICLQSVVLKAYIYSKILNWRLNCWLEGSNLLADEQNSFRKSRCTQDHPFYLNQETDYMQDRQAFHWHPSRGNQGTDYMEDKEALLVTLIGIMILH